ncbi:hypothetical protein H0H92_014790 [Tricholoma furcatifolium]|nr:hypothetical protein H0H92_014790 [Tricholoma furcatifolium]
MVLNLLVALAASLVLQDALAHNYDDQVPLGYARFPAEVYRGFNGEVTADAVFAGITTFAKLPWVQCLTRQRDVPVDIAILGAPFVRFFAPLEMQTTVKSLNRTPVPVIAQELVLDLVFLYFDPGLFHWITLIGIAGIREGSRRLTLYGGYNVPLGVNPFNSGLRIVDCGDIPVTPYDNMYAIQQIENGHKDILQRAAFSPLGNNSLTGEPLEPISLDGKNHPRIITLGGDHTIVLPLLRSIHSVYGPISVIHFDSHLGMEPSRSASVVPCDPSFLFLQHGAIRTTLSSIDDYYNDDASGFKRIEAREIDTIGTEGIVNKIRETVGDRPVYLSIDIDSIDPAFAPATGTPETGGWSTRELRTIIRGLDGLKLVSADIVEVAPAYDTNAELTTMAAADVLFEVLSIMAKNPLGKVENKVN